MKKQIIATTIILLFIGVAVAPSINFNVVKASNDNDLVEVTTQACGINGFGNTTMKLTREQYQNLEQYLVDFRARLNQTSTRDEAVPIFKEAVVELDKYGLLPKWMSVERAQRLVNGWYQKPFGRLLNNRQQEIFPGCINVFCLLSAKMTYPEDEELYSFMLPLSPLLMVGLTAGMVLSAIGAEKLSTFVGAFAFLLSLLNPIHFMNLIIFYYCNLDVQTIGLKGNIRSEITDFILFLGYSGLMLNTNRDEPYFIGSAIAIVVI